MTEEQKYAAMSEFTKQNMIKTDFVAGHLQLLPDAIKAEFEKLEKARCSWYEDSLTRYYKNELCQIVQESVHGKTTGQYYGEWS